MTGRGKRGKPKPGFHSRPTALGNRPKVRFPHSNRRGRRCCRFPVQTRTGTPHTPRSLDSSRPRNSNRRTLPLRSIRPYPHQTARRPKVHRIHKRAGVEPLHNIRRAHRPLSRPTQPRRRPHIRDVPTRCQRKRTPRLQLQNPSHRPSAQHRFRHPAPRQPAPSLSKGQLIHRTDDSPTQNIIIRQRLSSPQAIRVLIGPRNRHRLRPLIRHQVGNPILQWNLKTALDPQAKAGSAGCPVRFA